MWKESNNVCEINVWDWAEILLTKIPRATFLNFLFATPRETATCVKLSPGKTGLMHSFLQFPEQHSTVQHFFPSTQSSFDEQADLELWCAHVDEDFAAGHTLLSGTSIIIKTDLFYTYWDTLTARRWQLQRERQRIQILHVRHHSLLNFSFSLKGFSTCVST